MDWSMELSTPPAQEPLTLDEVKAHVRVTTDDEDGYLTALLQGAREYVEMRSSLALITQTRKLRLARWPCDVIVPLPRQPLQSVTSVVYLDDNGASQTLAASVYQVVGARTVPDSDAPPRGYILPAYGQSWPSVRGTPECITITYVCGWTTPLAIPQSVRAAMWTEIAYRWQYRGDDGAEGVAARRATNQQLDNDLASYRCYSDLDYR
jgi:uncharacterized phiE125 gp8 family phage protein